jgi:hypothetical protein
VVVGVLATVLTSVLVSNRVAAAPAVTGYIACLVACAVWWLLQGTRQRGPGAPDLMTEALARGTTTPAAPRATDLVQLEWLIAAAAVSSSIRQPLTSPPCWAPPVSRSSNAFRAGAPRSRSGARPSTT